MNTKLKKQVPLTFLVVAAVTALFGAGMSQAAAEPVSSGDVSSTAISTSEAQAAQDYWTPERMKAAIPGDSLVADKVAGPTVQPQTGLPTTVPAQQPVSSASRRTTTSSHSRLRRRRQPNSAKRKVYFPLRISLILASRRSRAEASRAV